MPPFIFWAAGAIGALALAKLLGAAARKVNAELDQLRRGGEFEKPVERLERDPADGIYRPRRG